MPVGKMGVSVIKESCEQLARPCTYLLVADKSPTTSSMPHQQQEYKSKGQSSIRKQLVVITCGKRKILYSEVFKHKAVEQVGVGIPQITEVDTASELAL